MSILFAENMSMPKKAITTFLLCYLILNLYSLRMKLSLATRVDLIIDDCYNINRTQLCGICGHQSTDTPEKCIYPFSYRFRVEDQSNGTCNPSKLSGSCNQITSYCTSDSCLNGGTCHEGSDTFRCICHDSHFGMSCEQNREETKRYTKGIQVFISQIVKFNTNATVIISTDFPGSDLLIKMESDTFLLNYMATPVDNIQHYTPEMRERFCKEKTGLPQSQCKFIRDASNYIYTMTYKFPAIANPWSHNDKGPMIFKGEKYASEESEKRIGYLADVTITAYQIKIPTVEKLPYVERDYKPVFGKNYTIFVYYNNQTFCIAWPTILERGGCTIYPNKRPIYAPYDRIALDYGISYIERDVHERSYKDKDNWYETVYYMGNQCYDPRQGLYRKIDIEVIVRKLYPHYFEKDSIISFSKSGCKPSQGLDCPFLRDRYTVQPYVIESGIISTEITGIVDLVKTHPKSLVENLNKTAGLTPPNFATCFFEIRRVPIMVFINLGINQTYYINTEYGLTIDARKSKNLNRRDEKGFNMKWSCKLGNTSEPCFTKYMFNDTADYFTIGPNLLAVDKMYNFSVKLSEEMYELTTSYAFIAVDVGSNKPFVIRLLCPKCWSGYIANPNDYIILVVNHEGKKYRLKDLKYVWKYKEDFGKLRSADDIRVNQTEDYIFKIEKNTLQYAKFYHFHVHIESEPSVSTYITLKIEKKHIQDCKVNPREGIKGVTLFDIKCQVIPHEGVTYVYEFFNKDLIDLDTFSGRMLGTSTNGDLYKFRLTRELVTVVSFDSYKNTEEQKIYVKLESFNESLSYIDGIIDILKTDATFESTGIFHLQNSQRDLALPSAIAEILTPEMKRDYLVKDFICALMQSQMLQISEVKLALSSLRNILVAMSNKLPEFTIAADEAKHCANVLLRVTTDLARRLDHAEIEKTLTEAIYQQLAKYVLDTVAVIVSYKNKEVLENIEEFVNPIVLDLVQQSSNELVESLDQISNVLLMLRTPGDSPSEIRSLKNKITSWVKAGYPKDIHHRTVTDKSLPLRISDDLAASMKAKSLLGLQFVKMNINPFWWAGGQIVTNVLFVVLCNKEPFSLDYSKMCHLPYPIQLIYNITASVQSIKPIIGEAKPFLKGMSNDEKDLSLAVYRFDPPVRAKMFIKFFFEENKEEYKVLFKKNSRPDVNDMSQEALLINSNNPIYNIAYDHNDDDNIYYMGILPVNPTENDKTTTTTPFKLKIYYVKCNTWLKWQWADSGCWVGKDTSDTTLVCDCSHLSLFAGTVATPNNDKFHLRDFELFLTPQVNFLPFITLLVIVTIYIILFIWSKLHDKTDMNKMNIIILEDNYPGEKYGYLAAVYTGSRIRSGTTANVGIKLLGTQADSRPHILKSSIRRTLTTNSDDWFFISCPQHLGNLYCLHLWHDNTTNDSDWFLDRVKVFDLKEELQYTFHIYDWIALNADMFPEALVAPVGLKDRLQQNPTFADNLVDGFRDSHYWTSVLWRHPRDPLTRVYRLQVVFCFTMTAMAVSLILYLARYSFSSDEDKPSYKLSSFDCFALIISLLCALIISSFAMCLLSNSFSCKHERNLSALIISQNGGKQSSHEDSFLWRKGKSSYFANLDLVISDSKIDKTFVEVKEQSDEENEGAFQTVKVMVYRTLRRTPLVPAQFTNTESGILIYKGYLACFWLVCVITSLICCCIVIIFGWSLETVHSYHWLTIFLMTIIIDIFLLSVLKIILSSAVLSILLKRMIPIDSFPLNADEDIEKELYGDADHLARLVAMRSQDMYSPLSNQKKDMYLEKFYRRARWETVFVFLVIVLFLVVTAMLTSIYNATLYSSNHHTKFMMSHGHFASKQPKFQDIFNRTNVEDFLQYNFISQLYRFLWYNLTPLVDIVTGPTGRLDWTDDCLMRMVGNAYLRQLRVVPSTCPVVQRMKNTSVKCVPSWSESREDKETYYIRWSSNVKNSSLTVTTAWRYNPPDGLSSSQYYGASGTLYPEGGYFGHLGYKKRETRYVISNLLTNSWLDYATRALFFQLTLYNANTNLFSHVTLIAEQLATGEVLPRVQVVSISTDLMFNVWNVSFIVFLVLFTGRTILQINKFGFSYVFSENLYRLEMLIIGLGYCYVIIHFVQLRTASYYVGEYQRKGINEFFSFIRISEYVYLLETVMIFLFSFISLRLIYSLRFGRIFLRFFYAFYLSSAPLIWLILCFLLTLTVLWRLIGYLVEVFVFLNKTSTVITLHPHDLYVSTKSFDMPLYCRIFLVLTGFVCTTAMMIFVILFAHFYKVALGYKIADFDNYNFLEFLRTELKQVKDTIGKRKR